MPLCQYCDTPRVAIGYFGSAPVSLCQVHVEMHGHDFDRVVREQPDDDPMTPGGKVSS